MHDDCELNRDRKIFQLGHFSKSSDFERQNTAGDPKFPDLAILFYGDYEDALQRYNIFRDSEWVDSIDRNLDISRDKGHSLGWWVLALSRGPCLENFEKLFDPTSEILLFDRDAYTSDASSRLEAIFKVPDLMVPVAIQSPFAPLEVLRRFVLRLGFDSYDEFQEWNRGLEPCWGQGVLSQIHAVIIFPGIHKASKQQLGRSISFSQFVFNATHKANANWSQEFWKGSGLAESIYRLALNSDATADNAFQLLESIDQIVTKFNWSDFQIHWE